MYLIGGSLMALAAGSAFAAASLQRDPMSVTEMSQIPGPRASIQAAREAPRSSEASAQLTMAKEGAPVPTQLTSGPKSAAPSPQLAGGRPSAHASAPLSKPSDGRATAVERFDGVDRCDPRKTGKKTGNCDRVIENRAAEFQRTEAPSLSPEQRILVGDQALERLGVGGAARRLANNGGDSNSLEAQGVASIVLRKPTDPPAKKEEPAESSAEAAAAAIVNTILNQPH